MYVHGPRDPEEREAKWGSALEIPRVDVFALLGLGLGYPALELLSRLPKHAWLLLVDTREDLLRAGLETLDWSPLWNRPRTAVFAGTDYARFLDLAATVFLAAQSPSPPCVIRHPFSYRIDTELYQRMEEDLARAATRRRVELGTLIRYAERLEENAIFNLPAVAQASGVEDFRDAFRGVPGYLLAAGPSLNEAIPHLREIQDRAVLVAVDKCTKLLLREGIRPHFTVVLDMTGATKAFYEGMEAADAPALVFDPDAYHETVAAYPGPRVSFETVVPWSTWIGRVVRPKGWLDKGISVAHTAFQFLLALGCRPIVFVGVDLAYPGDSTHAEGVVMNWGGKVKERDPQRVHVPCVQGGTVRSSVGFQTFITLFEIQIAKSGARVINTTPAGALVRGAENAPIGETARTTRSAETDLRERVGRGLSARPKDALERLRAGGSALLARFREIHDASTEALPLLKRLARLDPTNPSEAEEYGRLARRLNSQRVDVMRQEEALPLLQRVIAMEGLEAGAMERDLMGLKPEDGKTRARIERERMDLFFRAYQKSAAFAIDRLSRVLEGPR